MSTELEKAFGSYTKHNTGNINSWKIRTLNHGAKAEVDIDNFILGELDFNAEGERIVRPLSAVTEKGYLVASPERRYMDEPIDSFFNAAGERARIVYLDEGLRFDTSAFSGEVKAGNKAHFDPATKKFIAHDGAHADYATAVDKFVVVSNEEDLEYTLGAALVRLEVL